MKKFLLFIVALGLGIFAMTSMVGCENKKGSFISTLETQYSVKESVKRFEKILDESGLSLFQIIDHAQNAKHSDMTLMPETVVVFGNPKMGTILMKCNPSMGMDLPLKMLFYEDYEGRRWISYTNPEYYSLKHNIKDKQCLDVIKKAHIALEALAYKTADIQLPETNSTKE